MSNSPQPLSTIVGAIAAQLGHNMTVAHHRRWAAQQFSGLRIELVADKPLAANIDEQNLICPGYLVADIHRSAPTRLDLLLLDNLGDEFDADAWLRGFAEIGGGYALTTDGRLNLFVGDCEGKQLEEAMAQVVGHPDRQHALKTAIQQRQCGEVSA